MLNVIRKGTAAMRPMATSTVAICHYYYCFVDFHSETKNVAGSNSSQGAEEFFSWASRHHCLMGVGAYDYQTISQVREQLQL